MKVRIYNKFRAIQFRVNRLGNKQMTYLRHISQYIELYYDYFFTMWLIAVSDVIHELSRLKYGIYNPIF